MNKILLCLFFILLSFKTHAKLIKIAVIDTGFNVESVTRSTPVVLCNKGHKSFTKDGLRDNNGHGTNIAHIIARTAKKNYCLVIIKFFNTGLDGNAFKSMIKALKYVNTLDVDIVNISAGGDIANKRERHYINQLLNKKAVFVAAGNESTNLDKTCNFFPACYHKDLVVVGNAIKGKLHNTSNYGKIVDLYYNGVEVKAGGKTMTGTSQSTAIATGKFVKFLHEYKRIPQSDESEALKQASKAAYKQTGLNKIMSKKLKAWKKQLPDSVVKTSEIVLPVADSILIKKRVDFKWEF